MVHACGVLVCICLEIPFNEAERATYMYILQIHCFSSIYILHLTVSMVICLLGYERIIDGGMAHHILPTITCISTQNILRGNLSPDGRMALAHCLYIVNSNLLIGHPKAALVSNTYHILRPVLFLLHGNW
jgi:hypothetical protein